MKRTQMGYCAKAILSVLIGLTLLGANARVSCAMVPGKSWPSMKTYDIWGANKQDVVPSMHSSSITMTNDALLQDYSRKSNLRHAKVLNFFPVLNEDECKTEDGRRIGICMNVYDCHRKGGTSKGQCALGFGSCCVFTATCNQEVKYNVTYLVSPSFPAFMPGDVKTCKMKIKMMSPDVSQLRFDFVHFSIGQPNRLNGNCDGDLFSLLGGATGDFKICGQNNGQHIYYDVPNIKARDNEATSEIDVLMNFTNTFAASRFWEIRVSQIPFSQRAPAGCLQYFFGTEGIIQTFNFAENGRHLANQNYKACIRQEVGMCSIAYEPCNEQSFKIGPTRFNPYMNNVNMVSPYSNYPPPNAIIGPNGMLYPNPLLNGAYIAPNGMLTPNGVVYGANGLPTYYGPGGMLNSLNPNAVGVPIQMDPLSGVPGAGVGTNAGAGGGAGGGNGINGQPGAQPAQADQQLNSVNGTSLMAGNATTNGNVTEPTSTTTQQPLTDDVEGSGDDSDASESSDVGSLFTLGSLLTRAALFRSFPNEAQHERALRHQRTPRQFFSTCTDRITMPCIVEDFISVGMGSVPKCSPVHCGFSLCTAGNSPCRVESTVTPFGIGVHFGDGNNKGSAEENIGACIRFKQQNCI